MTNYAGLNPRRMARPYFLSEHDERVLRWRELQRTYSVAIDKQFSERVPLWEWASDYFNEPTIAEPIAFKVYNRKPKPGRR